MILRVREARRTTLSVLLLAAALRLLAFALFADLHTLRGDEVYYVSQARALATSGTYPGALRPPLESVLIALVFLPLGDGLAAVRLVQIVVSLATVALVMSVARARFGERAALASGLLCALHPALLHYAHLLWSENLYALLLVLAVWSLERFDRTHAGRWLVAAGASVGLARPRSFSRPSRRRGSSRAGTSDRSVRGSVPRSSCCSRPRPASCRGRSATRSPTGRRCRSRPTAGG
jgi:4-amino-4-deoxy-L-arabinose transferase-like glycosyltransferase